MTIEIKRTYDARERGDGWRVLVERLWPRGMTKSALAADAWLKEVAPSTELRKWFGHRVERWEEFRRRYRTELAANPDAWRPIFEASETGTVTLLYSARDSRHNGALVLREYIRSRDRRSAHGGVRSRDHNGTRRSIGARVHRDRRLTTSRHHWKRRARR
jgi:uncharacterized protein YeaO (DUF488 family)